MKEIQVINNNYVKKIYSKFNPYFIREKMVFNTLVGGNLIPKVISIKKNSIILEFFPHHNNFDKSKLVNVHDLASIVYTFNRTSVRFLNFSYILSPRQIYLFLSNTVTTAMIIELFRGRIKFKLFANIMFPFFFEILRSSAILRSSKYLVHNDLRGLSTGNLLYGYDHQIKLIDFESCRNERISLLFDIISLSFDYQTNTINISLLKSYILNMVLGDDFITIKSLKTHIDASIIKLGIRYLRQFNDNSILIWKIKSESNYKAFVDDLVCYYEVISENVSLVKMRDYLKFHQQNEYMRIVKDVE